MELRHLRYFVAAAEERSFVQAARRLRVAQPALSKQVRDLEDELGVELLRRLPRGVRPTPAGEAFLVHARATLQAAEGAIASVRGSTLSGTPDLRFAHGELAVYNPMIEGLFAAFREVHPERRVFASSKSDEEAHDALQERLIDVAAPFIAEWPVAGFEAYRLVNCPATGVLLPASHPLAAKPKLRLEELQPLTWLHSASLRWPGFFATYQDALRERGLVPQRQRERPKEAPTANMQIAAGDTWALSSEANAAPYRAAPTGIVYRPFVEPPIPCWIALVWLPHAAPAVCQLIDVARRMHLTVGDDLAATT